MKNLPVEFSFQEFLHNDIYRKEYFESQLMQVGNVREVLWRREHTDKFPLFDYVNEQCMAKVWVPSKSSEYNQLFNIKTIDVMEMIQKNNNKMFVPRANVIVDSRLDPAPQKYALLRQLLVDDMTVTTVKQMRENPRNVVFAIR